MPEDDRYSEIEEVPLPRTKESEAPGIGDYERASERLLSEDIETSLPFQETQESNEAGGSRPHELQEDRPFRDAGEAASWRLEGKSSEGDRAMLHEAEELEQRRSAEREFHRAVTAGEVEFQEPTDAQVQTDELILSEASERDFNPDDDRFWDHHGNDRAFYTEMAQGYKEIEPLLEQGMTPEQVRSDPERAKLAQFWWNEGDPIRVVEHEGHQHLESGFHRYFAAKEAGIETIPVQMTRTKRRG